MQPPVVLVVQHQSDCPPGLLGRWLSEEGCRLDVRRAWQGDPVALTPAHAGAVVLGGSKGAHDDRSAPWLPSVRAMCTDAMSRMLPLLGVCLGHQLLAVAVGARSVPNPNGKQIGVRPMGWQPGAGADPLLGWRPEVAVQWNDDVVVDLPGSVEVLARAGGGEVQAARFGPRAWGVQCHPEADAEIVSGWAERHRGGVGVDTTGYVAQVRESQARLARAWRPVAAELAAMLGTAAAVVVGR